MEQTNNIVESLRSRYLNRDTSSGVLDNPLLAGFNPNRQSATEQVYIPTSETHEKLNDGTFVPKYDKYIVGVDNAELNAMNQSTSDKWLNGLSKFVGKTANAIVGGTVGSANGIVEFIKTGSMDSVYDNRFNRWLDDLNVAMDNKLPNYYSQEEIDGSFFSNLDSANFWANDVFSGISFTVGAIGSEILIGKGAGLIGKLGNLATLPQKINNVSRAKALGSNLVKGMYKDVDVPYKGLTIGIGKAKELGHTARFLYTSSGYEAGVEALQFKKEQEEGFYDKFLASNGRMPTDEEASQFFSDLSDASNALWAFNTVLTGTSKLAQIGNLVGIKAPSLVSSKWVNTKVFGAGLDASRKVINPTKFQKVARKGYGLLRSEVTEGFEEGMQAVGSGAAERWLTSTYDPKYINSSMDVADAFIESLGHTFTTSEGLKEVLTGALVGGITGRVVGRLSKNTASQEFARIDKNAKEYSEYSQQQLTKLLAFSGRMQQATEQLDAAEESGDINKAEQSRRSQIIAQVEYADSIGYGAESYSDTVAAIQSIDSEAYAKENGITIEEAENHKSEMLLEFQKTKESYDRNKQFAKYYLGDNIHEANEIQSAVASILTLGEGAYDFNTRTLEAIKNELSGIAFGEEVLDIKSVLDKATESTQRDFNEATKELFKLQSELKELENKRKEVLKQKAGPDNDFAQQANNLSLEIAELQERKVEVSNKLNSLYQLADLENPYSDGSSKRVVSEQALTQLDSVLKNLSDLPSKVGRADLQKAMRIEQLIREYNNSNKDFKSYADLSRQLTSGEFKADELSKKAFKNKAQSELMVEFLETIGRKAEKETAENTTSRTAEIIKKEKTQPSRFSKIIEANPFLQGRDVEATKPTKEEIEEYLDLKNKVEVEGLNNPDYTERLEELQDRLDSWEMLDSFTNEGISILDMVEMEDQNNKVPDEVMPETMTVDEVGILSEGDSSTQGSGHRYEEISQTYEGVQVRTTKDGTFLHSTDAENFLQKFSQGVVTEIPNGYSVTFEDGTTATFEDVRPGVVKVTGWDNLENNTGVERIKYKGSKSSYSFVFVDGRMMEGSLENSSEYNFDAVYNLKPGDKLSFRVDVNNEFNQTLTPDQVQDNVKIYIIDSKGNIVGDVKSNNSSNKGVSDGFKLLRLKAKEVFENGGGMLPVQVSVEHVYLGTPVFELENGVPIEQPLDPKEVVDWGYYSPSGFELKGDTEGVRTSFVSKFDRRVPVVVFKRGNNLVAFPVNLKTGVSSAKGQEVMNILGGDKSIGKSVVEVNNILLENGLPGSLFFRGVNDQNIFLEDGSYSQEVLDVVAKLDSIPTKPDLLSLEREALPISVSSPINLSSRPITSPKIVMDLENMVVSNTTPAPAVVQQQEKEKKVKEVATKEVVNKKPAKASVPVPAIKSIPKVSEKVAKKITTSFDGNVYNDYKFGEGSTEAEFRAVAVEGSRVIGPREFFTVVKGRLVSDTGGVKNFPENPKGWSVSVKVETLTDENTTNIQNKKC